MTRYVTVEKCGELTGYTPDAIRTKIKTGVWLEGRQYIKAPDGRVLIDMQEYEEWATSHPEQTSDAGSRAVAKFWGES